MTHPLFQMSPNWFLGIWTLDSHLKWALVFDLLWSISVLSEFQCLSNPCTRINPSTGTKEPSKRANHKGNIKFLNHILSWDGIRWHDQKLGRVVWEGLMDCGRVQWQQVLQQIKKHPEDEAKSGSFDRVCGLHYAISSCDGKKVRWCYHPFSW